MRALRKFFLKKSWLVVTIALFFTAFGAAANPLLTQKSSPGLKLVPYAVDTKTGRSREINIDTRGIDVKRYIRFPEEYLELRDFRGRPYMLIKLEEEKYSIYISVDDLVKKMTLRLVVPNRGMYRIPCGQGVYRFDYDIDKKDQSLGILRQHSEYGKLSALHIVLGTDF